MEDELDLVFRADAAQVVSHLQPHLRVFVVVSRPPVRQPVEEVDLRAAKADLGVVFEELFDRYTGITDASGFDYFAWSFNMQT